MIPETTDSDGETLIAKVMSTVRSRIASRILTPGAKLPSIRSFSTNLKVSKSTVVEAYDRLAAEGLIRSRPGSGFFVAVPLAPLSLAELGPKLDREVDPLWISRQALESGDDVLKPGCGWLPPSWMPEEGLRRALRALARGNASTLVDYGSPLGLPALRALLARRIGLRGIEVSPEQIMLTESGTQAIDLLCRFLLKAGDTVLVDDPCYFNFHALLRAHQAEVVGIPYTPTGPDVAAFADAIERYRPRLYITNSALQNPTGATLSPLVAHRLLKLAEQAGLTIVEDDIFADFEETPAPRLAAFDGLERVVHIGSFSKSLSAAVRCGFIVLDRTAGRPEDRNELRWARLFRCAVARTVDGRQLPQTYGRRAPAAGAGDGGDDGEARADRHYALARAAGRHVPLVQAAGRRRRGRAGEKGACKKDRPCPWQRLQSRADGQRLPPLQRRAVPGRTPVQGTCLAYRLRQLSRSS